jgi:hypothetical protein
MAPVHSQIRPRQERTCIAHQEHGRTAVLLGPAQPTQHVLLRPVAPPLRVLLKELIHHVGEDVAGGQRVDADGLVGGGRGGGRAAARGRRQVTPFRGEVARQLEHSGFGGVVRGTDQPLEMKCLVTM